MLYPMLKSVVLTLDVKYSWKQTIQKKHYINCTKWTFFYGNGNWIYLNDIFFLLFISTGKVDMCLSGRVGWSQNVNIFRVKTVDFLICSFCSYVQVELVQQIVTLTWHSGFTLKILIIFINILLVLTTVAIISSTYIEISHRYRFYQKSK